jgi:predicted amidohydrolase
MPQSSSSSPQRAVLTLAAAEYRIQQLATWDAYEARIERLVERAAARGACVLVFPEYAALELAAVVGARGLAEELALIQPLAERFVDLYARLAVETRTLIVAPSFPLREGGTYYNRAFVASPDGGLGHQDKLVMTRFEAEQWDVSPGTTQRVFETSFGRFGVLLCYDAEFPVLARRLTQAGADVLLVPSATDTPHGAARVRIAAQARALENQCVVALACTRGNAPWSAALDENFGVAGVFVPPDLQLPADGVVAAGAGDAPWLVCDAPVALTRRARTEGAVLNARDWAAGDRATARPVEVVRF